MGLNGRICNAFINGVNSITNKDIRQIAMEQSAVDLSCSVEDFMQPKNTVVISKMNQGRKKYFKELHFCQFVCYGKSLVASVDEQMQDCVNSYVGDHLGFRCFEMPKLALLNEELKRYGKCVGMMVEYFLPDITKSRDVKPDFDFSILRNDDITDLYGDDRFHNALRYARHSERRDVIAVVGYRNKEIVGIAGASNDSTTMWQVGIDVVPAYRGKGVASVLTRVITDEILSQGIVPFYGTTWSHIASKNTAIDSGYKPAWVELAAIDVSRARAIYPL